MCQLIATFDPDFLALLTFGTQKTCWVSTLTKPTNWTGLYLTGFGGGQWSSLDDLKISGSGVMEQIQVKLFDYGAQALRNWRKTPERYIFPYGNEWHGITSDAFTSCLWNLNLVTMVKWFKVSIDENSKSKWIWLDKLCKPCQMLNCSTKTWTNSTKASREIVS